MKTLATVFRFVRRASLPVELEQALVGDLRSAFEGLSDRQKHCYLDWVSSATLAEERASRAMLVANVVRTLSELAQRAA